VRFWFSEGQTKSNGQAKSKQQFKNEFKDPNKRKFKTNTAQVETCAT
jgi:hypothetical protein